MEPMNRDILFPDGCRMRLYGHGSTVLWLIGEEEAPWLDDLPEDAAVVTVSGMDWDRDLSPWPAPPAFRGRPFSGGAAPYLRRLTEEWMPQAYSGFSLSPVREGILGYSLAGLFSLWALSLCGRFSLAASVSGSLWYDGFLPWLETHPPSAGRTGSGSPSATGKKSPETPAWPPWKTAPAGRRNGRGPIPAPSASSSPPADTLISPIRGSCGPSVFFCRLKTGTRGTLRTANTETAQNDKTHRHKSPGRNHRKDLIRTGAFVWLTESQRKSCFFPDQKNQLPKEYAGKQKQ